MVFCIETFSAALCLVHATDQGLHDIPSSYYEVTEHSNYVYGVIFTLNEVFEKEFQSILDKMMTDGILKSFDSLMKATLSRFVKMSKISDYFNFMLLCSMAEKVAFYIFTETGCFTFSMVTSLCLRAVYDRCYKKTFKKKEKLESLGCYCKRINPTLLSKEDKGEFSSYPQDKIRSLLQSLLDVDYENFALTDSEAILLKDALNLVKLEGIPAHPLVSMDFPCESDSDSDSDFEGDKSCIEKMIRLNLNEFCYRVSRTCKYCDGKCIKLLYSYLIKARSI